MTLRPRVVLIPIVMLFAALLTGLPLQASNAQTSPVPGIPGPAEEQGGPALAPGPDDHVYVGDRTGLIRELDETGTFVRNVATLAHRVSGLAVDGAGNLYASERWYDSEVRLRQSRVSRISPTGDLAWSTSTVVGGTVAVVGDTVWIGGLQSDTGSTLSVYGLNRTDGTSVGSFFTGDQSVRDLAAHPNGTLMVATDTDATEYTTDGTALRALGDFGAQLAVGPNGDLYGLAGRAPGGLRGPHSFQLHRRDSQGHLVGSYAPESSGFVGDILVTSNGVVWLTGYDRVPLSRIDPSTPDANLSASTTPVDTGAAVNLDASGSTALFTDITGYEWDLDGDGHFERATGLTPAVSTSFATAGIHNVSVRVMVTGGGTSVATTAVDVRTASAPGPLGVSINAGAGYTNDPNVTISARWPRFATHMLISNDGGFWTYRRVKVGGQIPWTLVSSGPGRLPKTIYVRFEGGAAGPETYQDDIILDQADPEISSATAGPASYSAMTAATARGVKTRVLRVKASDTKSGVRRLQANRAKSARGAVTMRYRTRLRIRAWRTTYVRVKDGAGNWSRWRLAKRRR